MTRVKTEGKGSSSRRCWISRTHIHFLVLRISSWSHSSEGRSRCWMGSELQYSLDMSVRAALGNRTYSVIQIRYQMLLPLAIVLREV